MKEKKTNVNKLNVYIYLHFYFAPINLSLAFNKICIIMDIQILLKARLKVTGILSQGNTFCNIFKVVYICNVNSCFSLWWDCTVRVTACHMLAKSFCSSDSHKQPAGTAALLQLEAHHAPLSTLQNTCQHTGKHKLSCPTFRSSPY